MPWWWRALWRISGRMVARFSKAGAELTAWLLDYRERRKRPAPVAPDPDPLDEPEPTLHVDRCATHERGGDEDAVMLCPQCKVWAL